MKRLGGNEIRKKLTEYISCCNCIFGLNVNTLEATDGKILERANGRTRKQADYLLSSQNNERTAARNEQSQETSGLSVPADELTDGRIFERRQANVKTADSGKKAVKLRSANLTQ